MNESRIEEERKRSIYLENVKTEVEVSVEYGKQLVAHEKFSASLPPGVIVCGVLDKTISWVGCGASYLCVAEYEPDPYVERLIPCPVCGVSIAIDRFGLIVYHARGIDA